MLNVLIAEDDENIVKHYQTCLAKEKNIEIVGIANDGQKAIEFYNEKKPDLILLDLGLPIIDGISVIESITQNSIDTHPNIIVVSGNSDLRLNLSNMKKVYNSLPKPLDYNNMIRLMNEYDKEIHKPLFPILKLKDLLINLGIKTHSKSCQYLMHIIEIAFYTSHLLESMTILYSITARNYNVSPKKIESSIRSSVRIANKCENKDLMCSIFHKSDYNYKQQISSKQFIELVIEYLER